MDAPEKLCFVNCGLPADQCACYRQYLDATFLPTILATEHDRIVAEKDAEIERLRETAMPTEVLDEVWVGSRAQRDRLRAKLGGRCAYCGCVLDKMHADHREPVIRVQTDPWGRRLPVSEQRQIRPERNVFSNMMPSCGPCNIHKGGYSLEEWREMLGRASEIIGRKQSIFKTAVRLGLIKVNDGPVTFYFEILRAASETPHPDAAQEYILAAEHDRIVAEKDAEIARLKAERDEAQRRRDEWRAKADGYDAVRLALREKVGTPWPPHMSRLLWAGIAADEKKRADDAASEIERLHAAARDVVLAYLEANPMRTADIHPASCGCLRCEIDRLGNACGRDPCGALDAADIRALKESPDA